MRAEAGGEAGPQEHSPGEGRPQGSPPKAGSAAGGRRFRRSRNALRAVCLRRAGTGQGRYHDFHGTEKRSASQPAVDRFDGRIGGVQPCRMVG